MIVTVTRPARPYADVSDLTTKAITSRRWEQVDGDEAYVIRFAVNLSAAETEAIQRRLGTASDVEEALQERAVTAYTDLLAFEALANPTNAQTLAAVRFQSRVIRGLIRAQYRRYDAVD